MQDTSNVIIKPMSKMFVTEESLQLLELSYVNNTMNTFPGRFIDLIFSALITYFLLPAFSTG